MSDSKFIIRLNKVIWDRQLESHGNNTSDNTIMDKKRSLETIPFSESCNLKCKHLGINTCNICNSETAHHSEIELKAFPQVMFRQIPIESWMFTERILTNVHVMISKIPEHLQTAFVSCSIYESSLTALGVLSYSKLIKHIADLHVENVQKLMRPVIQKLMQHPRNPNIFNTPVDYVTLHIPDYILKIPRPMDLGTVKSRLLRGEYANVEVCASDIALVFQNAITYNPTSNPVHQIAQAMREEFDADMGIVRERFTKEVSDCVSA